MWRKRMTLRPSPRSFFRKWRRWPFLDRECRNAARCDWHSTMGRRIAFFLIAAVAGSAIPSPAAAEYIVVGGEEAYVDSDGMNHLAIPIDVFVEEFSLNFLRVRGDKIAELRTKLVWSSPEFETNLKDFNARQRELGEPHLGYPRNGLARIKVPIYSNEQSIRFLEKKAYLPLGTETIVSIPLDVKSAKELQRMVIANPGWYPQIDVEIEWMRDKKVTLHPNVNAKGVDVKQPKMEHVPVTVNLSYGVEVPPNTRLIFRSTDGIQMHLIRGTLDLGLFPAKAVDYVVEQRLRGLPFRNVVGGRWEPLPDGSRLSVDLPVDVAQVIFLDLNQGPGGYLLFLFRDQSGRIRVAYHPLRERTKNLQVDVLHEAGVPLLDGLLLHFNTASSLVTVWDIVSEDAAQPTQFWKIKDVNDVWERIGSLLDSANEKIRKFFTESVSRRAHWVQGLPGHRAAEMTELALLAELAIADCEDAFSVFRPYVKLHDIATPIEALNRIDDDWLAERFPGTRLSVRLRLLRESDALAEELRRVGSVITQEDNEGAAARTAVLDMFERTPGDSPATALAHELLAASKELLDSGQKRRFWNRLSSIILPRDATMTEAVSLLSDGRTVWFDDGTRIREVNLHAGRLSLDLSGLTYPNSLNHVAADGIRAFRISLAGSRVPADAYRGLAEVGASSLEFNLEGSTIADNGLSHLLRQPESRTIHLNLRETAIERFIQEDLERLHHLDVDLSDATKQLDNPFHSFRARNLKTLRLVLSRTRWRGNVELGGLRHLPHLEHFNLDLSRASLSRESAAEASHPLVSYPGMKVFSIALPRFAGKGWLAGNENGSATSLDALVVSLDPGTNADLVFSDMASLMVKRTSLHLANTVVTKATTDRLLDRLRTQTLELDLRGTRIPRHIIERLPGKIASAKSVRIILPDGGVIEGGSS